MEDKSKKKAIISLVSGIVVFLILLIGAAYAYFRVLAINNFGSENMTARAGNLGSVVLSGSHATLSMELTPSDMRKNNSDIIYYAGTNGKTTTPTTANFGTVMANTGNDSITNDSYATYHCEYQIEVTHSVNDDQCDFEHDLYYVFNSIIGSQTCYGNDGGDGGGTRGRSISKNNYRQQYKTKPLESTGTPDIGYYDSNTGYIFVRPDVPNEFGIGYKNASEGQIILSVNGIDYDFFGPWPDIIKGEFDVNPSTPKAFTAGLRFVNSTEIDQTYISGASIDIDIEVTKLECVPVDNLHDYYWAYEWNGQMTYSNAVSDPVTDYHDLDHVYLLVGDYVSEPPFGYDNDASINLINNNSNHPNQYFKRLDNESTVVRTLRVYKTRSECQYDITNPQVGGLAYTMYGVDYNTLRCVERSMDVFVNQFFDTSIASDTNNIWEMYVTEKPYNSLAYFGLEVCERDYGQYGNCVYDEDTIYILQRKEASYWDYGGLPWYSSLQECNSNISNYISYLEEDKPYLYGNSGNYRCESTDYQFEVTNSAWLYDDYNSCMRVTNSIDSYLYNLYGGNSFSYNKCLYENASSKYRLYRVFGDINTYEQCQYMSEAVNGNMTSDYSYRCTSGNTYAMFVEYADRIGVDYDTEDDCIYYNDHWGYTCLYNSQSGKWNVYLNSGMNSYGAQYVIDIAIRLTQSECQSILSMVQSDPNYAGGPEYLCVQQPSYGIYFDYGYESSDCEYEIEDNYNIIDHGKMTPKCGHGYLLETKINSSDYYFTESDCNAAKPSQAICKPKYQNGDTIYETFANDALPPKICANLKDGNTDHEVCLPYDAWNYRATYKSQLESLGMTCEYKYYGEISGGFAPEANYFKERYNFKPLEYDDDDDDELEMFTYDTRPKYLYCKNDKLYFIITEEKVSASIYEGINPWDYEEEDTNIPVDSGNEYSEKYNVSLLSNENKDYEVKLLSSYTPNMQYSALDEPQISCATEIVPKYIESYGGNSGWSERSREVGVDENNVILLKEYTIPSTENINVICYYGMSVPILLTGPKPSSINPGGGEVIK